MSRKLIEHLFSLFFVSAIFVYAIWWFGNQKKEEQLTASPEVAEYLALDYLNFDNPLHRALLKESLDYLHPERLDENEVLLDEIASYRAQEIADLTQRARAGSGLTQNKFVELLWMYLNFILVFGAVSLITYYGVQTIGTWRYIRWKQGRTSYIREFVALIKEDSGDDSSNTSQKILPAALLLMKAFIRGSLYFTLFSPAYVIAYSFKTRFDTDTAFFMVLLGVISNGLLMTYSHKFYTFLVNEGRKGYVRTATVKNLNKDYKISSNGIPPGALFSLRKQFPGHVFNHIYLNARHQYLLTLKEQSSFLITGLVIIEMALNIQGHLCYELLQNLLYQHYDTALAIILGIFLVVKTVEIITDGWHHVETERYQNRGV